MLKVTLFRGTDKGHEALIAHVPQNPPRDRRLLFIAVIHEEGVDAGIDDAKVLLYQEISDPDHYWIRKENSVFGAGRTNYVESDALDAVTALGGFETSVRSMLERLTQQVA